VIQAVLFDGDQTLWDFEKVMRDALLAVLAELRVERPGPFTDALTWEDLSRDRTAVGEELDGVEYNLARLRVLGFARTLERLRTAEGSTASGSGGADGSGAPGPSRAADVLLAEQIGASYFAHRDRDPALFPDTVPCLQALRGHYRLGLLSNGSRLPETVGLGGFFESVVFAQDHRVAKPEKALFEVVEQELGLDSAACVLVGDHPLNDVVGAKRAGWRAVWLDRDGQAADAFLNLHDPAERPDAVVSSLAEIPGILRTMTVT
jgi:HAD superfamily hydrolase (TIGR01509 family)